MRFACIIGSRLICDPCLVFVLVVIAIARTLARLRVNLAFAQCKFAFIPYIPFNTIQYTIQYHLYEWFRVLFKSSSKPSSYTSRGLCYLWLVWDVHVDWLKCTIFYGKFASYIIRGLCNQWLSFLVRVQMSLMWISALKVSTLKSRISKFMC